MSASSFASLRLCVFAINSDFRSQSRGIPPREGDVQKGQARMSVRIERLGERRTRMSVVHLMLARVTYKLKSSTLRACSRRCCLLNEFWLQLLQCISQTEFMAVSVDFQCHTVVGQFH
jgi:hypothetical protein